MAQLDRLSLIQELSNANGVSGFEDEVVAVARKYAQDLCTIQEDSLRNLYLHPKENKGNRPVITLDAHSDEVGFMVQAVKSNGTMHFLTLGRWVSSNVAAHTVRVRTADGSYIPGVTASTPPHFLPESQRNLPPSLEQMTIDVGATSKKEALEKFNVQIGAPVVPDVTFSYQEKHDLMLGKGFDCRLGCAAVVDVLHQIQGDHLAVDVVGTLSAQEEVGTRGATLTANRVKPDIAIVFEGCPADDTTLEEDLVQTALKRGPMLRHIDQRMITNPRFQRFALDLARKHGIPVQEGVRSGGSTNGAPIHLSNQGVPVIVIGVPVRYIHTHYGFATLADYTNSVKLAVEIVRAINGDIISGF